MNPAGWEPYVWAWAAWLGLAMLGGCVLTLAGSLARSAWQWRRGRVNAGETAGPGETTVVPHGDWDALAAPRVLGRHTGEWWYTL